MPYEIIVKEPAERKLRKFPKDIQRRFAKRAEKLAENPHSFGKPLRNVLAGYWEDYFERRFRIIYTIDENSKTITIEAIKHKDEF
ncbi:MAG: type II toxin-antitoxin system RelE/ParE family toxin [Candidatus Aenigmarchaeota archaeon]|nr:type II toxin-antitoxin system RelE/ParE family toxin [Candidatus Aenigmarchaeota archaeon]